MLRRDLLGAAGPILGGTLAAPGLLRAQGAGQGAWPNRPIRLIVPFTPGGSTDILARAIAAELPEAIGQAVVVENRGGAGGTIGTEVVARAPADGHTLMMGHIGTLAVNPTLYPNLSFDTARAFDPVVLVAVVPNVLVVHPSVRAASVAEFIALARARPRGLTYGSGGNGSAAHIAMVALAQAAGIAVEHIPYRGTAPMMTDLIGGTIDATLTGGPPALPPVRAGQLRALGVSSRARLPSAPDIPTIAEAAGLPALAAFEAVQWYGLVAPAGTPRPVVERLNQECARILTGETLRPRLAAEGAEASPGTPEAFGAYVAAERARWGEVVRTSGMRAD